MSLLEIFSSHVEGLERILLHNNKKTGHLTREHNLCPWELQQTVGRPDYQRLQRYCQ